MRLSTGCSFLLMLNTAYSMNIGEHLDGSPKQIRPQHSQHYQTIEEGQTPLFASKSSLYLNTIEETKKSHSSIPKLPQEFTKTISESALNLTREILLGTFDAHDVIQEFERLSYAAISWGAEETFDAIIESEKTSKKIDTLLRNTFKGQNLTALFKDSEKCESFLRNLTNTISDELITTHEITEGRAQLLKIAFAMIPPIFGSAIPEILNQTETFKVKARKNFQDCLSSIFKSCC